MVSLQSLTDTVPDRVELVSHATPILSFEQGITVRAHRCEDAPSLAQHANDPAVWTQTSKIFNAPYTLNDARAYIISALDESNFVEGREIGKNGSGHPHLRLPTNYAICVDDIAIGGIALIKWESRGSEQIARLGYWLGKEYWSRGIISHIVPMFVKWAFTTLEKLRKIEATGMLTSSDRPLISRQYARTLTCALLG